MSYYYERRGRAREVLISFLEKRLQLKDMFAKPPYLKIPRLTPTQTLHELQLVISFHIRTSLSFNEKFKHFPKDLHSLLVNFCAFAKPSVLFTDDDLCYNIQNIENSRHGFSMSVRYGSLRFPLFPANTRPYA